MSGRVGDGAAPVVLVAALRVEAWALGGPVTVVGMGPDRAAAGGAALAARLPPDVAVVVSGVCGGLDGSLAPGTVLVADRVAGEGLPERTFPQADTVAAALRGAGLAVAVGPLWSSATVVRGAARRRLAATGAVAVDMESAALVAALPGRPVAVVRVVADTPDHGPVRGGLRALVTLRRLRRALAWWPPGVGGSGPA